MHCHHLNCEGHTQELVAKGALKNKTVDLLKQYCRHYKLKATGKKQELLDRVTEHVNKS